MPINLTIILSLVILITFFIHIYKRVSNKKLPNISSIIAVPYIFYPFVYVYIFHTYGNGYKLINNADDIINFYWILSGVFTILSILYLLTLKKNNQLTSKQVSIYIIVSILLMLLYWPYTMIISSIDFALFGW